MREPDYERLLADIIEVAKEQPDTSFKDSTMDNTGTLQGCIYVNDDGSPCCIVGQAWSRQEPLDVEWFSVPIGGLAKGPRNGKQFTLLADEFGSKRTEVIDTIRNIQRRQDEGTSWGDAVAQVVGPLI